MQLSDFDFHLPEELIATRPAVPRSSARLLVSQASGITDSSVTHLAEFLNPGDRLVFNDTKVIPARLMGLRRRASDQGQTEAKIEVTLLEPRAGGHWSALLKPLKKVSEGEVIHFSDALSARLVEKSEGQAILDFAAEGAAFDAALDATGRMPLPPYIAAKRPADDQDLTDYQTVFAKNRGAVAAPTASLHFDETVLASLKARGVECSFVTLHVGAGTFLPVKVDDVRSHKMHAEWGRVTAEAAAEMNATRQAGGRVIPVGTTALRLIESAARDGAVAAWEGETDIFIYPGFSFQVTDALMTNFHLPKSTLMMLVSALVGAERIREVYEHAIDQKYRFFSYGDSSLLMP